MSSNIRSICKKSKERIHWGSKWIPYQNLPVRNSMTANAYMRDFKASRKKKRGFKELKIRQVPSISGPATFLDELDSVVVWGIPAREAASHKYVVGYDPYVTKGDVTPSIFKRVN